jgi:hypothetical protein
MLFARCCSILIALLVAVAGIPIPGSQAALRDDPAAVETVNLPGRVIGDLHFRSEPRVSADTDLALFSNNDPVWVNARVEGEDGDLWYQINDGGYLHAADVRLPLPPPQTFSGRWLDVELTTPAMVTAYEDDQPVFAALAIKGRALDTTPVGTYTILRRVYDETMDSETLGVPRDDPSGYYLEDVLYTQYFTDEGDSFHFNYWSSNFGEEGSHGCLGLSLDDAAWLWDWADEGTVVNIHA